MTHRERTYHIDFKADLFKADFLNAFDAGFYASFSRLPAFAANESRANIAQNDKPDRVSRTTNRSAVLGKSVIIAYICPTMHDALKDEELMLQYKDGDSRSFEILYSRYRVPMFRYLQNQCGNAAIAEEIFQDVWMNLIRARERYEVSASFKTFIYRMAHNRLIDHYRKQKHGVPSSYDEHEELLNMDETANHISPQRIAAVEQQVERLMKALGELPEAQREAFLLKEETGLSVEEIAEMTNVKPETAKSRIRYAMNKLKQALEI